MVMVMVMLIMMMMMIMIMIIKVMVTTIFMMIMIPYFLFVAVKNYSMLEKKSADLKVPASSVILLQRENKLLNFDSR